MADVVGIEIQLRENLEARLKVIIPLLENMERQAHRLEKIFANTEGINKTNRALNTMAARLNAVSASSRGITSVGNNLDRLGQHADRARQKVSMLHRAFGGVAAGIGGIGGMLTAGLSIYTVGDMFKHGMDFDQQMNSLKIAGISPDRLASMRQTALRTANDPNLITTPSKVAESMRIGLAITRNPEETERMAPLGAKFDTAMKVMRIPGHERNQAEFAYKMAEQLGIRDEKRMQELMDALTKMEVAFAGQVDLGKFTQNLSMTRTAKYGADMLPLFVQMAHLQTEAGNRGGGRAGMQIMALARNLQQGVMTQSLAQKFADLGLLSGYDEALATKGAQQQKGRKGKTGIHFGVTADSSGRILSTSEDSIFIPSRAGTGKSHTPTLTKSELGKLVVEGLKGRDLAIKDTPEWVVRYLIPAIGKKEGIDFWRLGRVDQVSYLQKNMAGMQINASDLLSQLVLQRQVYSRQLDATKAAPGMDKVLQQQRVMAQNLDKLHSSWETLGTTLTTNTHIVNAVNTVINGLTSTLVGLTSAIDPVTKFFADIAKYFQQYQINPQTTLIQGATNAISTTAAGVATGQDIQKRIHRLVDRVGRQTNRAGHDAWNTLTHPMSMLVPPPPPTTPSIAQMSAYPAALHASSNGLVPPPPPIIFHNTTMIGNHKIDHHIKTITAKQAVKQSLGQSYATSRGSGSYNSPDYSSSGGQ